ncbi:hypothetical protein [Paenibacillus sp. NFR01]|uniref:hypothetical protein n=1 Tax=Paenibacillus sp. NFR01 TaxID=1566279 RepID=UPI0008C07B93|nr:hypothetical protein [Paenibacillus sp. NFR01]SET20540.1 hypothetical protein SAMN03159358_1010 [Paenibacillus sp. NFR01]
MQEDRPEHRDHRGHDHHEPWDKRDCREHGGDDKKKFQSAQTFRRGRAIAFLERLNVKRATLQQQLQQPELDSIRPVISGELKATDAIIQEFIHMFELREIVAGQGPGNPNYPKESETDEHGPTDQDTQND